jgi:hypothetical protein
VEIGIGLATSAAATLRPLLRQVLDEISITGSSHRKNSRAKHTDFSGSTLEGSNGDAQEPKYSLSITGGADAITTTDMLGLYEWEKLEGANTAGILKTVQITYHV